jgi:putative transcriptional regulator
MAIVVRLDVMMAQRKMSLNALAAEVGISLTNLSLLKNGHVRGVRFNTLSAICKALECQPGDLLEYVEESDESK